MQLSSPQAYLHLFESIEKPLLYSSPWWLDATCGASGWGAVIQYEDEKPIACLPFQKTSISGLSSLITPPLTQWVSALALDKISSPAFDHLLSQLPAASIFDLTIKPISGLHVQSEHFPIDLKYSYVLPFTEDDSFIRKGYNEGLRRNIRQAEKNYTLEESNDVTRFIVLCKNSYQQQKMKSPPWLAKVLPRVFKSLKTNHCGQLILASYQGKAIAGVLIAWDSHSTYYLAGGRAQGDQAASAHALLLDHAIHLAQARHTDFDFEGSMHPGIANFFQSFGASPQAYWHIRKYRGFGKIWSALR